MTWRKYRFSFFGHAHLAAREVESLLDECQKLGVPIAKWGVLDGAVRQKMTSHREAAEASELHGRIILKSPPSYQIEIDVMLRGFVPFVMCEATGRDACTNVDRLFRALATTLPVDYGASGALAGPHVEFEGVTSPQALALQQLSRPSGQSAADYRQQGPAGVGFRTYLGKHFMAQIGESLLRSSPCRVEEAGRGILLSLTEGCPCEGPLAVLADQWTRVSEHLAPTGVFQREANGRRVKGPNCVMVYGPKG